MNEPGKLGTPLRARARGYRIANGLRTAMDEYVTDHMATILGVLLAAVAVLLAVLQVLLIIVGIFSFKYFDRTSRNIALKAAKQEAEAIAARAVTDFMQRSLPAFVEFRDSMEREVTDQAAQQIAEHQDPV